MKKISVFVTVILAILMMVSLVPTNQVNAAAKSDLNLIFYTGVDACFSALQAGTVDIMQWALTKTQKQAVEADPNLQLAAYSENDMYEFDINNNYTIDDYKTSLNPMWVEKCRQAVAYLVDKDYIINNFLEGFGSRIDAPVAYPQTEGVVNASVVSYDWNHNGVIDPGEDNYLYKYNVEKAAELLASLGFNDTDGNGYLNYPNDPMWLDAAGRDTTLMPLKIFISFGDPERLGAGNYLVNQLEGNPSVAGDSVLANAAYWAAHGLKGGDWDTTTPMHWPYPIWSVVMGARNYHIFTGGWSLGRYPTYLNFLFGSLYWYSDSYSYSPNYVTGEGPHTQVYRPGEIIIDPDYRWAHPFLDNILATGDFELITGYLVQHCVTIPLWSTKDYKAWRKELAGVVNMRGIGIINDYTFLNAYKKDGSAIVVGLTSSWETLNPMYSMWYFEYAFLDRSYTSLIAANPYDLSVDLPWAAQDWSIGTWVDPRDGATKTTVTYYLRKDVGGATPVTGTSVGNFNAEDYEFSVWYNYRYDDDWQQSNFYDVNHLETIDNYTVKVYFEDANNYFVYAPTYPLLGPSSTLSTKLCNITTSAFSGSALTQASLYDSSYFEYQFTSECVVHVINATKNGIQMTEGKDFYIRGGYDVSPLHSVFVNLTSFAPTDVITIEYYYAPANGAGGTYLGSNLGYSWMDTQYTYGTHYPVSITTTTIAMKKNPYFFLSPVLGEIDWRWTYTDTIKPRSGYYKIDILDVVKCTSVYCTRGDGTYNAAYLPSADIDSSDLCHIGILDLVTITGTYGQKFGTPPA
jgi:ABC-type transport system substrate-binding protein